ncbi:MAG: hypothetical protein V2B18_01630 [Pseudomonadota bacterium]
MMHGRKIVADRFLVSFPWFFHTYHVNAGTGVEKLNGHGRRGEYLMDWLSHPASPFLWQNAVFAAMIFLAMLYVTVSVMSGITGGDADAHGGDVHHDHGGGHELNDAHDMHAGPHHGDTGTHHVEKDGASPSFIEGVLNTQRRCPVTLAVVYLLMSWGVFGYIFNVFVLESAVDLVGMGPGFLLGFVITGGVAVFLVRRIASLVAMTMPSGKACESESDFIGYRATVSTILAPNEVGTVVIDIGKGVLHKQAILVHYEGEPLRRGTELIILDLKDGIYCVVPAEESS